MASLNTVPCTLTDSTGYYDLRGLYSKSKDYSVKTPSGINHLMNFCGPISTGTWAVTDGNKQGVYYEGPHGGVSLGQYNTTISNYNGVLSLSYNGGSNCLLGSTRSSLIQLQCGTSSTAEPLWVGSMNDCSYFYTFKTPYACPTTIGVFASVGTVISVFFSFILIALVVSFCSAVAYNRYFLKKSGLEQFPSVEVIRNGIEFVRDISVIIGITIFDFFSNISSKFGFNRRSGGGIDYTKGAWSRSARDGFDALPTEGLMQSRQGDEEDEESFREFEDDV